VSAAQRTVDPDRTVHSLHAYFLRAGDIDAPIVYDVDRARDGKSFSVRRIVAIQHGQPIFNFAASFQVHEAGFEHQIEIPDVARAEDLLPHEPVPVEELAKMPVKLQRWLARKGAFEFRYVTPRNELKPAKRPPYQQIWFRLIDRAPDDDALHRALLAYASDFHLIGTAMLPHGISYLQGNVQVASLDHALWFHRPFRADEWLLYSCDSPSAQGARGLTRGMIYSADGRLVASTAQEGLIRLLPE
jgi:acyl-CoA thioesterase II